MAEVDFAAEQYIKNLERTGKVVKSAIRQAIRALGISHGCGLDVPCGIGTHSLWLAEEYPELRIEGADSAPEHIEYASALAAEKGLSERLSFTEADMNNLEYPDDSFDFIWCCDGLWPGSAETGCIVEEPFDILKDFKRIVKPGGTIAILFWTAHRLLPGYPLLENALNASLSANIPVTESTPPELHIMNTPSWFRQTGLMNIKNRTFAADIIGPLGPEQREAFHSFADMLWGRATTEVEPGVWEKYKAITDPSSEDYILLNPDYAGFITYTMFSGDVPS